MKDVLARLEMSLHSTDLVFLTFMCCKPLGRGERAATKAGVLNVHHRTSGQRHISGPPETTSSSAGW